MNQNACTAMIVFAKAPIEGQVKTRLAKDTNHTFATTIYKACLEDLFSTLNVLKSTSNIPTILYLTPESSTDYFKPFKAKEIRIQKGRNLGERMKNAIVDLFPHYDKVILVGSDIPGINEHILKEAIEALDKHPSVIGPSCDGGYYLIGFASQGFVDCFQNIDWSTPQVLAQTLAKFNDHSPFLLPYCRDIDTLDDLKILSTSGDLPKHLHLSLDQYPLSK